MPTEAITIKQAKKRVRNEKIIADFKNTPGTKGAVIEKVAKKHKVSRNTVWNVLQKVGLVGII